MASESMTRVCKRIDLKQAVAWSQFFSVLVFKSINKRKIELHKDDLFVN